MDVIRNVLKMYYLGIITTSVLKQYFPLHLCFFTQLISSTLFFLNKNLWNIYNYIVVHRNYLSNQRFV